MAASAAAVDWARRCDHPNTLGYALCWGGLIPVALGRDMALVEERGREAMAVASELAMPLWAAWSRVLFGWGQVHKGARDEGLAEIARGLAETRDLNAGRLLPWLLALAGEAHALAGDRQAAERTIVKAFAEMQAKGDRAWAAELQCIRAAVMPERAKADLAAALAIAREQGAHLPELRSATRLARIRAGEGRQAEARDLLAPLYEWFTEGFETADVKEAKYLLELSG